MAKSPKWVWLFIMCLLLASCSQPNQAMEYPQASNGFLDLQNWDFSKNGIVGLIGEWEFYWQELLPPELNANSNTLFVPIPGSWTSYKVNGQALPAEGYATYRLAVRLPNTSKVYGLYIDGEGTAYTIWVDGKWIAQNGHVAKNIQEMVPQSSPQVVFIETSGEVTDFVIQISNFHHRKAGFRNEILLGLPAQIHEYQSNRIARDTFIMGIYLVIVLYHLAIYWFRPVNKSPLYFAFWSMILFLRASLLNQKTLLLLVPALSWSTALRIEYFTFYFLPAIYALFIQSLYPNDLDRWLLRVTMGLGMGFTLYTLFVDTLSASNMITPYQGILLLEMVYFIFFIGRILSRKREGALYIASASIIGFTGMILEILSLQNIIPMKVDGIPAFMAFVFIQAVLLSDRLSKSFHRVEVLSGELEKVNIDLLESEKKYRSIFEESKEMVFIAGLDGQLKDANPASEEILGYTRDELTQMRISDLVVHHHDKEKIESPFRGNVIVKDYELELHRNDGNIIHGLVSIMVRRGDSGEPVELQGTVHDISARIQAETERVRAVVFEQLSITDPLTNTYNRRIFDEMVAKEWERAKRSKSPLAVVLFDIDHFKKVNDTHGHLIGDLILTNLARLCLSNMRSMDIFARYGGEEFAILMPNTDGISARRTMERLRTTIEKTSLTDKDQANLFVTISVGIAIWNGEDIVETRTLLARADQALYSSKDAGRNRVRVWKEI